MSIQPFLIILVISGTLLLLAGTAALVLRSRRRRQMISTKPLLPHLESFRSDSPFFYRFIDSLEKANLGSQLLNRDDLKAALELLDTHGQKQSEKLFANKNSLLNLSATESSVDKKIQAAMTTVLRVVYFDEELRKQLPSNLGQELDYYLDNLTER